MNRATLSRAAPAMLMLWAGLLIAATAALAGQFPASGQTTAYPAQNNGDQVPVPVPDDGTLQRGATLHYKVLPDGTVKDVNTGLIWEVKCDRLVGCLPQHNVNNIYPWSGTGAEDTIWDWVKEMNTEGGTGYAGHSDWRVPNVRELLSIVDYGRCEGCGSDSAALNPLFGPTAPNAYWSSTTYADNSAYALAVDFSDSGGVSTIGKDDFFYPVRAVRGGPKRAGSLPATGQTTAYPAQNNGDQAPVPVPDDGTLQRGATLHYKLLTDGTVKDLNTGLIWEVKCDRLVGCLPQHNVNNTYPWSGTGAEETIWDWLKEMNAEGGTGYAGHNDWRVPNERELLSIVDWGRCTNCGSGRTAINPLFGPTAADFYWSSTTVPDGSAFALEVDFSDGGFLNFTEKNDFFFVRAVRGGPK